jgi:hypothetical protein
MIGEEHYCAKISQPEGMVIVCKSVELGKESQQIIEIIGRITLQLAELYLSFKKFKNTITIYLPSEDMTLSFYYHEQHFYVSSESLEIQLCEIIRTIVEDMELPLFRNIPQISYEKLYEDMLELQP